MKSVREIYVNAAINLGIKNARHRNYEEMWGMQYIAYNDYLTYYWLVRELAGECEYEFKPTPPRRTGNEVFPFWNLGYTLYLTTAMDRAGNWDVEKAYDRYRKMAEMRAPGKRD